MLLACADVTVSRIFCRSTYRYNIHLFRVIFQFEITDKLPKYLCRTCATSLEQAYKFKQQCELTEKQFLASLCKAEPIEFDFQHNGVQNQLSNIPDIVYVEVLYDTEKNKNDIKPIVVALETVVGGSTKLVEKNQSKKRREPKNSGTIDSRSRNDFHCDMCTSKFKTKRGIVDHLRLRHVNRDKDRHKCPSCIRSFFSEQDLRKHSLIHEQDNRQCKLCAKTFFSRPNLLRHVDEIHSQKKPFTCAYCQRSFAQMVTLSAHINCVHLKKPIYTCPVCDKRFFSRPAFYMHKKDHAELVPLSGSSRRKSNKTPTSAPKKRYGCDEMQCQYCGKLSTSQNTHINHLRTHTGEKPFECKVCGKTFSQNSGLLQHTRVHTGETPYQCDVCDKKFKFKIRLNEHILLHSGQRPHKCMHCDKTFTLRGNLTVHLRLHTGETPYECTMCDHKFTNLNALKRHRNNGHTVTGVDTGVDGME